MTRRDFVMISKVLRKHKPTTFRMEHGQAGPARAREAGAAQTWNAIVREFAAEISATNPRFDAAMFLLDCGVSEDPRE